PAIEHDVFDIFDRGIDVKAAAAGVGANPLAEYAALVSANHNTVAGAVDHRHGKRVIAQRVALVAVKFDLIEVDLLAGQYRVIRVVIAHEQAIAGIHKVGGIAVGEAAEAV